MTSKSQSRDLHKNPWRKCWRDPLIKVLGKDSKNVQRAKVGNLKAINNFPMLRLMLSS